MHNLVNHGLTEIIQNVEFKLMRINSNLQVIEKVYIYRLTKASLLGEDLDRFVTTDDDYYSL